MITVALACDVYEVRAEFAPSDTLSHMEQHAIEAVQAIASRPRAGVCTLHDLERFFGVSSRLVLDLVLDLWHAGHLIVDPVDSTIMLAEATKRMLTARRLGKLPPAAREEVTVQVALNLVTGALVPVQSTVRRLSEQAHTQVPDPVAIARLGDVPLVQLVGAVMRQERRDADRSGRRPRHCLNVARTEARPTRTVWDLVQVKVTSQGGDRVAPRVGEDGTRSARDVERIDAHLFAQLEDDQDDPEDPGGRRAGFRAAVRAETAVPLDEAPSIEQEIRNLEGDARDFASAEPSLWGGKHDSMVMRASRIAGRVDAAAEGHAKVSLLRDAADHRERVTRLLRQDADEQVILVGPWLDGDAFNQHLADDVTAAVRRGVRVVLGWGKERYSALPDKTRTLLQNLQSDLDPELLIVARASLATHAKVVVADRSVAIVSSFNMLSSREDSMQELGVAVDLDHPGGVVDDLLDWVVRSWPERAVARRFSTIQRPEPVEFSEVRLPTRPTTPEREGDVVADPSTTQRALSLEWLAAAAELRTRAAALGSRLGGMIVDAANRALLDRVVASAGRRLLITSDQINPQAVNSQFLERLRERAAAGVRIDLVYGRHGKMTDEAKNRMLRGLKDLARAHPDQVHVLPRDGWHGKVLVADDIAVVSSFNFLSFEGRYEEKVARRRSELGLRLEGPVVDDVLAHVADRVPGLPPYEATVIALPTPAVAAPATAAARTLRSLVEAAPRSLGERVNEALVDRSPTELLNQLQQLGAGEGFTEQVELVLATLEADDGGAVARLAGRWWRARRFDDVAVLLEQQEQQPGGDGPDLWLAGLAACRARPALAGWLGEQDPASLGAAARRTLGAVLAVEALVVSDEQAQPAAYAFLAQYADVLQGPAVWARDHLASHPPVRRERLSQLRAQVASAQEVGGLWQELRDAADAWWNASPPGDASPKVKAVVQSRGSLLAGLRALAAQEDLQGVRAWINKHGGKRIDKRAADIYDNLQTSADEHYFVRGRGRDPYERRIKAVLLAAAAVAAIEVEGDATTHAALALRAALQDAALDVQTANLPWPHRILVGEGLALLDVLREEAS
jgi:phosphatidylserine/phosphatidylglycerophosphate/cardiolipin synthase-like enzyme